MNAQQLRNSILQQAIQGKLVPQDNKEGRACIDIDGIRTPKKLSVFDDYLFDIPETWKWCKLYEVADVIGGFAFQSGDLKSVDGFRVIRISDVTPKGLSGKSIVRCNKNDIPNQYQIKEHDILIAMTGGTVGKSLLLETLSEKMYLNQRVAMIRSRKSIYCDYLDILIKSPLVQGIIGDVKNSTNDNISMVDILSFPIPLPPLAEQRRIVAKIEELMPLVERYGKAQQALDQLNESLPARLRQSILQEAIQGRLVPQDPKEEPASELLKRIRKEKEQLVKEGKLKKKDLESKPIEKDEIPFEVPEGWEWCIIGDLFAHNNGKQLNKGNARGKIMDYITTSNLYWDGFVLDKLKQMPFEDNEIERCQAIKGDLLVCEGGDIGRAAIWNYDYPIMLQNHLHKLRAYVPLCTEYFRFLFYYYNKSGMIGGKGIGIQGFSSKALHNTLVPLPPLSEQKRIVAKVEELFGVIKK